MELGLASSAPTATPRVQAARVLRSAARSLEHVITAGPSFLSLDPPRSAVGSVRW